MVFANCGVKSVHIPSTLKTLEAQTFYGCANLKSVEFSEGLEKICVGAFSESGLESVVLPSSTKVLCGGVFCKCKQLTSV